MANKDLHTDRSGCTQSVILAVPGTVGLYISAVYAGKWAVRLEPSAAMRHRPADLVVHALDVGLNAHVIWLAVRPSVADAT